eukprot:gene7240-349_t
MERPRSSICCSALLLLLSWTRIHAWEPDVEGSQHQARRMFNHWSQVACAMPRGAVVREWTSVSDEELVLRGKQAGLEWPEVYRYHPKCGRFSVAWDTSKDDIDKKHIPSND